jgi:adenylylsulfate kinase
MGPQQQQQRQFVVWLTGLSGAGKTTIAKALYPRLRQQYYCPSVELLDGDVVRRELSPELGFTKADRELHARRVVYLCKLLSKNGVASIVSLISPYREFRNFARMEIGNYVEVYVKCSLDACIQRDPKGLYKKALAGEIKDMTGLQDTYEEPTSPELIVETELHSLDEIVDKIISKLIDLGYIRQEQQLQNPEAAKSIIATTASMASHGWSSNPRSELEQ